MAGIVFSNLLGSSFWLHFAAAVLFTIGLVLTIKNGALQTHGWDRPIRFGPIFFAIPLAVFGLQHFALTKVVMNGVPSWIPGHLFWAYFVGIALIAAAVSIITGIRADLAALLVGLMLFLFVMLIYVPNLANNPHDRFALVLPFRDLALSGGALSLAGALAATRQSRSARWLAVAGRYFFAVPMPLFGVEHFLHPDFAPGVPLPKLMPPSVPGHLVWAYCTGTILIACGLCVLFKKGVRVAAAALGITFLVLVIFIYMPMEIVHPSIDISGELDYAADTLAMSGAALLVAGAASQENQENDPRPN